MEAPVKCRTFVRDEPALPTSHTYEEVLNPAQLAERYKDAGLTRLADNVGPMQKVQSAADNYDTLSPANYEMYGDYLSLHSDIGQCLITPPLEAVAVLMTARNSHAFDAFEVLSHPQTGEALLLGVITVAGTQQYFKLAQWGATLTTEADLRKMFGLRRAIEAWFTQLKASLTPKPRIRSRSSNGPSWAKRHYFAVFGVVTALLAGPGWLAFLLTGSWWLGFSMIVVMMIGCSVAVCDRTQLRDTARYLVAWIFVGNMILAAISGIIHLDKWNTAPFTKDVLVCGTYKLGDSYTGWRLVTDKGLMVVDPGFYNGVYYNASSQEAAESLVGNWVHVTVHGRVGDGPRPYVTEAVTLRPGVCGT